MDILPILFDAEFVLLVITLVIWALYKPAKRRKRRRKEGIRCMDGHIVSGGPVPQMTAEEIVRICRDL